MFKNQLVAFIVLILCLVGCNRSSIATSTKTIVLTATPLPRSPTLSVAITQSREPLQPTASEMPVPSPTREPTPTPRPTMTVNPTLTRMPVSPTPSPTFAATLTETQVFIDPRKSLAPGQYIVFWRQNTWYIQGLDGAPPERLMPVESPNFFSSISPDYEKVAFLTADDQVAIYDLPTGKLTTYPQFTLQWDVHFTWSPDSTILLVGGYIDGFFGVWDEPKPLYIIWLQDGRTGSIVLAQSSRVPFLQS